jgi:hypothetical protein
MQQSHGIQAAPSLQSRVSRLIPQHYPPVQPTPMPGDQGHLLGVGLIQGGIIQHQHPLVGENGPLHFLPQRLRVGRLSPEQASEGIVRGRCCPLGLRAGCLTTGETRCAAIRNWM